MSTDWEKYLSSVTPGSVADKIIGMIYGHALGDAVGLITEFKFKRDKPEIVFPYDKPIRGFPVCDWTDDTDHLILVMQSLIENKFKLVHTDIARRLKDWVSTGFKELGDTVGLGLGGTMNMVITHAKFLEDPKVSAAEIWYNSGQKLAANGSLMRTSIIGSLPSFIPVDEYAANLSIITHADPRCVASCVLQSGIIHNLIYRGVFSGDNVDALLKASVDLARRYISIDVEPVIFENMRHQPTPQAYLDTTFKTREEELSHWVQMAYMGNVADLKLDDMVKIGYALKCLACSIWVLQIIKISLETEHVPSFKKVILKLASECGDADTNCAVAGATLGSYLGYSNLPRDWINALPNREWLNGIIMTYIKSLETLVQTFRHHQQLAQNGETEDESEEDIDTEPEITEVAEHTETPTESSVVSVETVEKVETPAEQIESTPSSHPQADPQQSDAWLQD